MVELNNVPGSKFPDDVTLDAELAAHANRTDDPHNVSSLKGNPNGFASLDASSKVPLSQIPSSLASGITFQGTWDASLGSAPSGSPSGGDYWIVETAGNTNLDGITTWNVGDWALYDGGAASWTPRGSRHRAGARCRG